MGATDVPVILTAGFLAFARDERIRRKGLETELCGGVWAAVPTRRMPLSVVPTSVNEPKEPTGAASEPVDAAHGPENVRPAGSDSVRVQENPAKLGQIRSKIQAKVPRNVTDLRSIALPLDRPTTLTNLPQLRRIFLHPDRIRASRPHVLGPCAASTGSEAAPVGSLGSFTLVGTTLNGIRRVGTAAHTPPHSSVSSPFSVFSHPSRKQETRRQDHAAHPSHHVGGSDRGNARTVQWSFYVGLSTWTESTAGRGP